jgi:tetratricopeptide (TPR) repeat protein
MVFTLLFVVSCAYYNTYYNARKSYREALELAKQYPDNPVPSEEVLLDEAIAGAAKILAIYPESRWIDDAQLLLGNALLQLGRRTLTGSGTSDLTEAMMAFSSTAIQTDDQTIRDRAFTGMGLAAMELDRLNDAIASFENVSHENDERYISSFMVKIIRFADRLRIRVLYGKLDTAIILLAAWKVGQRVSSGIILHTTDGTTWLLHTVPTNSGFSDISFVDSFH